MKIMRHQYLKSVVTLDYNQEKCTGCGMCHRSVPKASIK